MLINTSVISIFVTIISVIFGYFIYTQETKEKIEERERKIKNKINKPKIRDKIVAGENGEINIQVIKIDILENESKKYKILKNIVPFKKVEGKTSIWLRSKDWEYIITQKMVNSENLVSTLMKEKDIKAHMDVSNDIVLKIPSTNPEKISEKLIRFSENMEGFISNIKTKNNNNPLISHF